MDEKEAEALPLMGTIFLVIFVGLKSFTKDFKSCKKISRVLDPLGIYYKFQ